MVCVQASVEGSTSCAAQIQWIAAAVLGVAYRGVWRCGQCVFVCHVATGEQVFASNH